VCAKLGTVKTDHYFDIINIDRYDIILGMVFMNQHSVMLDFNKDQVRIRGKPLQAICKKADEYLQVHRQAMGYSKALQSKNHQEMKRNN